MKSSLIKTGGMFIRILQNPMNTPLNLPPEGSVKALLGETFSVIELGF